jgi:hypothetical protein
VRERESDGERERERLMERERERWRENERIFESTIFESIYDL